MGRIFAEVFPVASAERGAVNVDAGAQLHVFAAEAAFSAECVRKQVGQFPVPGRAERRHGREGGCGLFFTDWSSLPAVALDVGGYRAGVVAHGEFMLDADARNISERKGATTVGQRDFLFERQFRQNLIRQIHGFLIGHFRDRRFSGGERCAVFDIA